MAKSESVSFLRSLFERAYRTFKLLIELHLQLARKEAKEDAQRILGSLFLLIMALMLLGFFLLIAHAFAIVLLQKRLQWDWSLAMLAVGGFDLVSAMVLALVARSQLQKPVMTETKALLEKTVTVLRG